MKVVLLGLTLLFGFSAGAYVPDHKLILSRTSENHGKGIYEIDQDVIFRTEGEPLVAHETWYIDGENNMRVDVEGRGPLQSLLNLSIVYKGDQRYVVENSGPARATRLPPDWYEPFFNFRFTKNIRPLLAAANILPANPGSREKREKDKVIYNPEPFLRLSRVGGAVAYAFGNPSPDGESPSPGIWIEQDQFVVRKLRLPSKALVQANDYTHNANSYWLAKTKVVTWGSSRAEIKVNHVKSYGRPKNLAALLEPSSIKTASKWPDQALVREFYIRFR